MLNFSDPIGMIFSFAVLIVAITVHEFAHALAADRLGDPTPRLQGRLTLNPLAHLDPVGTLLLLIAGFGWGKPVIFDPFNLRNPRRDAAIISLAGPISNVLLATLASIILRVLSLSLNQSIFAGILEQLIVVNIILAVFNLIPIHPLDGFKVVEGILPKDKALEWHTLERFGIIFLIFLLLPLFGTSPVSRILQPVLNFVLPFFIPVGKFV